MRPEVPEFAGPTGTLGHGESSRGDGIDASPAGRDLLAAVRIYEELLSVSSELRKGPADRRREAVQVRRLISERIAEIGRLGSDFFADGDARASFRSRFGRMRSTVSYHQASWPIVSIVPGDARYQASLRNMRETNREFIEWVRRTVRT